MKSDLPTEEEIEDYVVKDEDQASFDKCCVEWLKDHPGGKFVLVDLPDGIPDDLDKKFKVQVNDTPIFRFYHLMADKYGRKECFTVTAKVCSYFE